MSAPDRNKTTDYRYNGDGRLIELIARNAATGDQHTHWTYGTTLTESGVASFELLRFKKYPDSSGPSDRVAYTYNRLGEATGMQDQNGTVHQYTYDRLGRLLHDRVTALGTGIDSAVRMSLRSYNPLGLVEKVTQASNFDPASPAITDQVLSLYNAFGQLKDEYQEHSGAVATSSSPAVHYTYESGANNTLRRTGTTYPNARTLGFEYGTTHSLDDLADRVALLRDGTDPLATYTRRGRASTVRVQYHEPGLELTYIRQPGEPDGDAGDEYTGLDRFGRIEDLRWLKTGTATDVDRYQYGFDRAGQRTWRRNVVARAAGKELDEAYGNDGLGQLAQLARGVLNLNESAIAAVPKWEEQFTYDATGNWSRYRTLVSGTQTLDQSRTHNAANETTALSNAPNTVAYDPAGNMTKMPAVSDWTTAQTLVWDAWNRLVRVQTGSTVHGSYRYDGLTRRITKASAEGGTPTDRHYYYSDQWQVLEERLDAEGWAERQFLWGVRYADDLILRETHPAATAFTEESSSGSSASSSSSGPPPPPAERLYATHDQWHVTGLSDLSGNMVERYDYDAFGRTNIFGGNFIARTPSAFAWEIRFGAYRWDDESGLYQVRFRYLDPALGRWLRRDPIEEEGGINLYANVLNNPVNAIDSLGLFLSGCTKKVPCKMTWNCTLTSGPLTLGPNYPWTDYPAYSYYTCIYSCVLATKTPNCPQGLAVGVSTKPLTFKSLFPCANPYTAHEEK